jgi:ribosomal protein L37AE/L43A
MKGERELKEEEREKVPCYVCKKMIDKEREALAIGNDMFRCRKHRTSSVLKAKPEMPTIKPRPLTYPTAEVTIQETIICPTCGEHIIIRRAKEKFVRQEETKKSNEKENEHD